MLALIAKPLVVRDEMGPMQLMKKKILLITLLSSFALHAVSVGQEKPPENLCDEARTTAQMRECQNQRYQKADDKLNQVYRQLMSQLSKTRQKKLREAQRAWIQFRDKNAEFMASDVEGGTMNPLVDVFWLTVMTERRVAELKESLQKTPVN